ncbi:hypothetical protein IPN41_03250 [Candidatus Falkowbacteria bacterium]|nr:MAG: hypothetical protein IPN41_03250 [Candidatus Falkowbacteria bacterium]
MSVKFYFLPDELGISDNGLTWQVNLGKMILLKSRDLESSFEESDRIFRSNKDENFKFEQENFLLFVSRIATERVMLLNSLIGRQSHSSSISPVIDLIDNEKRQLKFGLFIQYPENIKILEYISDDVYKLHSRMLEDSE